MKEGESLNVVSALIQIQTQDVTHRQSLVNEVNDLDYCREGGIVHWTKVGRNHDRVPRIKRILERVQEGKAVVLRMVELSKKA